ncbi:MAG: TonB-dependent receptor [Bacteroidetes bacterium]|nr:TonB-dependent receptor [Bacteroidota bacterium]
MITKFRFTFLCLLSFCVSAFAQNKLSGKVSDESGEALIGVSVFEKGTTNGIATDANGKYSIKYGSPSSIIVFSYVGYIPQEIKAESKSELNITLKQGLELKGAEIVGSRRLNRTATETAVPVDIIDVARITNVAGQVDINQLLQYAAPSFNSNKQSGADGADHIDPATLRGLGPDQTLVLINGKRRHQSSLINIFGSRGRGNTGTDLNSIPASAIDHIEILRDGASAQYGSDAIAGVINIVLKSNVNEFTGDFMTGAHTAEPPSEFHTLKPANDYDGEVVQAGANYGASLGDGYANFTLDYQKQKRTNRPSDPALFDIYRNQFGDAASENFSLYFNSSVPVSEKAEAYAFGGYNYRFTDAFAWSRSADEDRNIPSIYPNGFDPHIQSVITDKSISAGVKSELNGWNMDVNNTFGSNRFHFYVDGSLNASMLDKSPTHFDAGGFQLMQNSTSVNFSKLYGSLLKGLNLAMGLEHRIENYQIFAGDEPSYKNYGGYYVFNTYDSLGNVNGQDSTLRPAGSQGFPGFQPGNVINESRTNIGAYLDAELDITKAFLVSGAIRFEHYSDFGNTTNGKIAARYKIAKWLSVRGSYSTGFRAPSLAQLYYNTTFTDFVAGVAIDKIIASNNSPITRTLGIPKLKEENSTNISGGITFNAKAFSLTIDAYSIAIKDRIVLTGAFYDDDNVIGPDLQKLNVGAAQFFTNAVNTTTTGVDAILTYTATFANKHILKLSLAGNFNKMTIDKIYTNAKLKDKEDVYFGIREQYFLMASAPKSKINFTIDYSVGNFFASAKAVQFGKVELINWNDNGDKIVDTQVGSNELDTYAAKMTYDLSLGYRFRNISLTLGVANLTNEYPDEHDPALTESGGNWDAVQMGFSGRFSFLRVGFKF